jgi:uncharacterized phage protein (TIGR01671 family)
MRNRTLKFRAWDDTKLNWIDVKEFSYTDLFEDEKYIVQQYTGLKDSKGNDIYEGDVVKIIYEGTIAEVYFDSNICAFRLKDNTSKSFPITTYRFDESHNPIGLINVFDEVIGNIFENSELLNNELEKN